ncbi:hypothetical protein BDV37DRAFT_78743 [Aspergillus pseudonomiae]|uniref:Hybrid NRPS/PKS enzyme n=1 Tax=Aspergillus pseudonomiae TaxID=1506151 RepID=A0A5N7DT20_9EURO|nr:uncharacterized protein BDV37DRAFT_78743 [Aspergillus pseudonomiae]KAE8409526.1 hypothetical protein BDV37DRAFT_78743 [Aspergillus pseudonomiae]
MAVGNEPIAIIGAACRFPGGASSPSKLWDLLHHPRDLSRKPPTTRFNGDGFYHPNPEHHTTTNVTNSYFLEEDHRLFDATFFNTTPKEAEAIDPQQRLLLETVYEAMESAGLTLKGMEGSETSVYVGLMCNDFHDIQVRDPDYLPQYIATGASRAIISNRVSYFYDWKGPSMTIDTACSSSLVAIHQAVQSLRSGESTTACAAGANLLLSPENYQAESNLHMLSPSGWSQMWDAKADGYARGEGIAAVFLKTLSSALADGDHIEGIIRETGVNSDGRTRGITMPSNEAQLALIRATYAKAGLDPLRPDQRCQYFEAHGTGTPAGDPLEASAISRAFFNEQSVDPGKLLVGSIKTVVGHTEGAAGVAGVLKAMLAMQNGIVPPNQHFESLNPGVKPWYTHLEIPTAPRKWPATAEGTPRRASINSFGFGGTNSHVILEHYDPAIHNPSIHDKLLQEGELTVSAAVTERPLSLPIVLSAHTEQSLLGMIQAYSEYLKTNDSVDLKSLAWALLERRSVFPVRIAFSPGSQKDVIAQMDAAIERGRDAGTRLKILDLEAGPRILGVFTGQGAQWATMGRALILHSQLFRKTIEDLEQHLSELPHPPSWSLKKEIMASPKTSRLEEAALSQPLCTAVQVATVNLLHAAGVSFHTVVGHSSGEIAAAYTSGCITAHEAIRIAYYRGYFANLARGSDGQKGGMLAAGLSFEEARKFCDRPAFKGHIVVAASNSPSSVTLSGDLDVILAAKTALDADGKFARALKVDTAYHSPHMQPCSEPYLEALTAVPIHSQSSKPGCAWLSSVYSDNGRPRKEELSGTYWRDNMANPVLFSEAVQAAYDRRGPFDICIEAGPHATLKGPATQTIKEVSGSARPYQGALHRGKDDVVSFGSLLGFLWTHLPAGAIDFKGFATAMGEDVPHPFPIPRNLPSYQWEHNQVHWREGRLSKQYRGRPPFHELLGTRLPGDVEHAPRWRNILRGDEVPWLRDHRFQGQIIVPAAAYCVMAVSAAQSLSKGLPVETIEITDLEIENAITLPDGPPGAEVLFTLHQTESTEGADKGVIRAEYACFSGPADGSGPIKKIFTGKLSVFVGRSQDAGLPARSKVRPILYPMDVDDFYEQMTSIGLNYTGSFRGIQAAQRRLHNSTIRIGAPGEDSASFLIHPITLDVCFQAIFAAYASPDDGSLRTSFLPQKFGRIVLAVPECQANIDAQSSVTVDAVVTNIVTANTFQMPAINGDLYVFNEKSGKMQVLIEELLVSSFAPGSESDDRKLFLEDRWNLDILSGLSASRSSLEISEKQAPTDASKRVAHFYLRELSREGTVPRVMPEYKNLLRFASSLSSQSSGGSASENLAWASDTENDIADLVRQDPDNHDLRLSKAIGERLPAIVSGDANLADDHIAAIFDQALGKGSTLELGYRQLGSVAKQIAHKHPRMSILEIGAYAGRVTGSILQELDDAFSSYTVAHTSSASPDYLADVHGALPSGILTKDLNLNDDLESQGFKVGSFDLIIAVGLTPLPLPLRESLSRLRGLLKPGGFSVFFEPTGTAIQYPFIMSILPHWWSLEDEDRSEARTVPLVTWDRLLRKTGYSGIDATLNDGSEPQTSLIVSQATDNVVKSLRKPLQSRKTVGSFPGKLLILGGKTLMTSQLISQLELLLESWFQTILVVDSLEHLKEKTLVDVTAVLSLKDIDSPFIKDFNKKSYSNLKLLFERVPSVLWLLQGHRQSNPYHAASLGLLRTIAAEIPQLHLQCLDVEQTENQELHLAESILRLVIIQTKKIRNDKSILWTAEQELVLHRGLFWLPRIVPVRELNDRLNSIKRLLQRDVDSSSIQVILSKTIYGSEAARYTAVQGLKRDAFVSTPSTDRSLHLSESSLVAVRVSEGVSVFVGLGRDLTTDAEYLALLPQNSSLVTVPASWTQRLQEGFAPSLSIEAVLRYLVARRVVDLASSSGSTVVHGLDSLLASIVWDRAQTNGKRVVVATDRPNDTSLPAHIPTLYLHPHASKLMLRSSLPRDTKTLIDISVGQKFLGRLKDILPHDSVVLTSDVVFSDHASSHSVDQPVGLWQDFFVQAIGDANQALSRVRPTELLQAASDRSPLTIIDWTGDERLPTTIQPLDASKLFSSTKTYLLVGLTGELGQFLCRWMINNGAHHIVVSSRNPQRGTRWEAELRSMGADLHIEPCDVTRKPDVVRLVQKLRNTLPPVAGVVNGAMIMHDQPFADMDEETFRKVLRPKVDGSNNLDEAFWDAPLDFFIMTSSTAAVVGNPGQANYATANQYMVGLAAQRKARGVAGSVVDIGMIMGIGYIRRSEGKATYEHFLGKQNLMPISEHDIRDIFSEAILGGHPVTGERPQIMTGLAKVDLSDSSKRPSWIANPRFSHHNFESEPQRAQSVGSDASPKTRLRQAGNAQDASLILQEMFAAELAVILQLPPDNVNKSISLLEMGADSLVAVEIRSWFLREVGQDVPVLKLLGGASVVDLCDELAVEVLADNAAGDDEPVPEKQESDLTVGQNPPENVGLAEDKARVESSASSDEDSTPGDTQAQPTPDTSDNESTTLSKPVLPPWLRIDPMSYGQSRIWFPSIYLEDKTTYNCTTSYRLNGLLDVGRLETALRLVTQRHESFRTSFHTDSFTGDAKQVILRRSNFRLQILNSTNDKSDVEREFNKMHSHVYDLERGDTFRVVLLSHAPDYHTIVFGYHHIMMDGVSWQLTLQDIERCYTSPTVKHPIPLQYSLFAEKQRQAIEKGVYAKQLQYWKSQFRDLPSALPLFSFAKTSSRKAMTKYETIELVRPLEPALTNKVRAASKKAKVTTLHFYLTAFQVMLHHFLGVDDQCVGIVDANRTNPDFMQTIGFLLNMLPLRFKLQNDPSFEDMVQQTRTSVYAALGNSDIPIDLILDELDIPRSTTFPPLFQTIFNYRMGALKQSTIGEVGLEWHDYKDARNPYDITVSVDEKDDGTGGFLSLGLLDYLFDREGGQLLITAYVNILEQATLDPGMRLSDYVLFPEGESSKATSLGLGKKIETTWPDTLSKRINQLVETQPDEPALKDSSGSALTYRAMGDRANAIAASLSTLPSVRAGSHIGVCCHPSTDLVCALLAILRLGAVYVPLDPSMPVERLALICEEAQLQALVHDKVTASIAKHLRPQDKNIVDLTFLPSHTEKTVPDLSEAASNAFIMFTSGSTGKPKGVQLTNANYMSHVLAASQRMGLQKETVLQQSSVSFDLSLAQIFYCLSNGGTLIVTDSQRDPEALAALIQREGVTFTFCVPSEYSILLRYGRETLASCKSWRIALSSGEAFPVSLKEKFRDLQLSTLTVLNAYGPTEGSIVATMCEVDYQAINDERVPIGSTLDNYAVYVVDDAAKPVPVGFPGELVLGGPGISPGYWRNPELTKQKFIPDSISGPEKAIDGWKTLYRTGDKARLLEDGSLVYQGRIEGDLQVKLRGVRVELEEIENAILNSAHGVLSDAAVVLRGETEKFLAAFVVFADDREPKDNSSEYLRSLRSTLPLPLFMKPAIIENLAKLPMTASGKLDRRALSTIPLGDIPGAGSTEILTPTELQLSDIWQTLLADVGESLKIEKASDFFSVGGNSLLLLKMQAEIRDRLSIELSLPELFQNNTLEGLAARIDAAGTGTYSQIDWEAETAVSPEIISVKPVSRPSKAVTKSKTVLLTGATGFLGRALRQQLADSPEIGKIECLAVRNPTAAREQSKKISFHAGNLNLPLLGLSESEADRLFASADIIIHNGADVSFMKTYHSLRKPNVESTKELVRLAAKYQTPFHFISTSGVAHLSGKDSYPEISVAAYQPPTDGSDGYVASKWASERFLERVAAQTGLPVWIHRPTSVTGADTPTMDIVHTVLRYSRLLKSVPELPGWGGYFDFVHVESVARTVLETALAGVAVDTKEPVYVHHCGETVVPVQQARAYVEEEVGETVTAQGTADWIAAASAEGMDQLVAAFLKLFADGTAHSLVLPRLVKGGPEALEV